MNTIKHLDFFDPNKITNPIHIIGVGAIGSYIALFLSKLGIKTIHIYDFDTVDEHNITNQVYDTKDLNKEKVEAISEKMLKNNPDMIVVKHGKYEKQPLYGYVFLAVDSIETRRNIAENNRYNNQIKIVIDSRIGLETGQVLAINWHNEKEIENYIQLCSFNDKETDAKVTACGVQLSVAPSVLITVSYAISQLINFVNNEPTKQLINFNAFNFKTVAM